MKLKLISKIAIVILSIIIISFNLEGGDKISVEFSKYINPIELKQENFTGNSDKQLISKDLDLPIIYGEITFTTEIAFSFFGTCGEYPEKFHQTMNRIKFKDGNEEKRRLAAESLMEMCDHWYDYYYSLSKYEKNKLKHELKQESNFQNFFKNSNYDRKELIKDAKSFMATGGDGSGLSRNALRYLLNNDRRFIVDIADNLGIGDSAYIKQNVSNIVDIYMCQSGSQDRCSTNSFQMLYFCMDFGICNTSFEQYIASKTTPNNYMDILTIVEIIKRFVKQGYFDI